MTPLSKSFKDKNTERNSMSSEKDKQHNTNNTNNAKNYSISGTEPPILANGTNGAKNYSISFTEHPILATLTSESQRKHGINFFVICFLLFITTFHVDCQDTSSSINVILLVVMKN